MKSSLLQCYRLLAAASFGAAALALVGCAAPPPAQPSDFSFVRGEPKQEARVATGSIYNGRQSDNWFGRGRNFRVGDVITVLLNESTQAARKQSTAVSRSATNDVMPAGVISKVAGLGGLARGFKLDGGTVESAGDGTADQQASLTGALAVSVIEVLPNGNLVVRGEKKLTLSEGSEVIEVAGVIRPEDIAPNNTVQSRRLAHSQITYRGSGEVAAAAKTGWGTQLLHRYWPF